MAIDSRKYFDAAQDRKNDLSKEFGAAHASDDKPYDLSAVVEAANNFLGGYEPQTAADVQRLLYDAATNPGSLGASVMVTSHMPNVTPEEQKKKEDEAHDALVLALQEQIREANERISKMIDECREMAEWCRKQAETAAEAMDKIANRMAKNSQFIEEVDEIFESFKANGQFDREKARRLLQERGIKTDEKISDAKLMELLQKEWTRTLKENNDLSELHDEYQKEKDKFEARQKELEEKARELRKLRDEANKIDDPSDRAKRLKELDEQYGADVQYIAKELEQDKVTKQALSLELKERFDTKVISENRAASDKNSDGNSEARKASVFMAGFAASANPAEKQVSPDEDGSERRTDPASEKPGINVMPKSVT